MTMCTAKMTMHYIRVSVCKKSIRGRQGDDYRAVTGELDLGRICASLGEFHEKPAEMLYSRACAAFCR